MPFAGSVELKLFRAPGSFASSILLIEFGSVLAKLAPRKDSRPQSDKSLIPTNARTLALFSALPLPTFAGLPPRLTEAPSGQREDSRARSQAPEPGQVEMRIRRDNGLECVSIEFGLVPSRCLPVPGAAGGREQQKQGKGLGGGWVDGGD